jgi:hypothetical protein
MLTVLKYDKERHLALLKDWAESWNLPPYPWDYIPSHGWVAYHDDSVLMRRRPLACVMIRECENQTAIVDLAITAPEKNTQQRVLIRECMGKAFAEAEFWGEQNKIKFVMGVTTCPSLVEFAEAAGFGNYDAKFLWRVR